MWVAEIELRPSDLMALLPTLTLGIFEAVTVSYKKCPHGSLLKHQGPSVLQ